MNVTARVAYLRGLLEGMELDTGKKEGKLWKAVLSVLEELAACVTNSEQGDAEFSADVDALNEQQDALEEDSLKEDGQAEEAEQPEVEEALFEVVCPTCGEVIYMDDKSMSEGSTVCPACGEVLEFDLSEFPEEELV